MKDLGRACAQSQRLVGLCIPFKMSSARRSGRLKGPRTTYTTDPFESAGISDDSGSEEQQKAKTERSKPALDQDSGSDDEFLAEEANEHEEEEEEEEDEEDDEEAYSDDETPKKQTSKASRRAGRSDYSGPDEPGSSAPTTSRTRNEKPQFSSAKSRQKILESSGSSSKARVPAAESRFRGCNDVKENESKPMHYMSTFGDDTRDLLAAVYARDRWARGVDTCLPTRYTLDHQNPLNEYEFGPTWGVAPEDVERERTSGWDWYYDAVIGQNFQRAQKMGPKLSETEARRKYLPHARKGKHTVLVGPANHQKAFHLGHHESMNFGEAWADVKAQKSDRVNANVREGWLISFEQKIQCLAWAPCQEGLSQYLAVVTPIRANQKEDDPSHNEEPFSPFRETPSYPCALQLWEFLGEHAGPVTRTLDMKTKPRLRLLVCTEWGDLRRIAWCPMGRAKRDADEQNGTKFVGLLAGIWGDGKMRVLDIKLSQGEATEFGKHLNCEGVDVTLNFNE